MEAAGFPGLRHDRIRWLAVAYLLEGFAGALSASPASAEGNQLPSLAVAARETFDAFAVPAGKNPGKTVLNKSQISGTLRGDELGL